MLTSTRTRARLVAGCRVPFASRRVAGSPGAILGAGIVILCCDAPAPPLAERDARAGAKHSIATDLCECFRPSLVHVATILIPRTVFHIGNSPCGVLSAGWVGRALRRALGRAPGRVLIAGWVVGRALGRVLIADAHRRRKSVCKAPGLACAVLGCELSRGARMVGHREDFVGEILKIH